MQTKPDPPPREPPPVLEYATPSEAEPRISGFVTISHLAAFLACPCILGPALDKIEPYLPSTLSSDAWVLRLRIGFMIVATLLPVAAIFRIRSSNGLRTGMDMAVLGLVYMLIWWGLTLLI